jgi:hypothetical protein
MRRLFSVVISAVLLGGCGSYNPLNPTEDAMGWIPSNNLSVGPGGSRVLGVTWNANNVVVEASCIEGCNFLSKVEFKPGRTYDIVFSFREDAPVGSQVVFEARDRSGQASNTRATATVVADALR